MKRKSPQTPASRPAPRTGNDSQPWQPRFGIREMLMLMLICSVLAASLGYLYQDQKSGGRSMRFIIITVAGPTTMAIALGAGYLAYEWTQRKKRKRRTAKENDPYA